jgi:methyl-accepting chemotaxis protein
MSRLSGAVLGSIQAKIVAVVLGAALITVLCVGVFVFQMRRNIEDQIVRDHQTVAETYAGLVDEYLASARWQVESMANQPAIKAPLENNDKLDPKVRGLPHEYEMDRRDVLDAAINASTVLRSFIILNEKGDIYILAPWASQNQPGAANLADRDYFVGATKTGKTFWSDVNIASTDGTALASVAVPIKDKSGKLLSVVTGSLQFKVLNETAARVDVGDESTVMLFDSKGKPIVYPDNALVQAAKPLTDLPAVADALAGKRGPISFHNPFTERDEMGSIVQLKTNGWFVVVSQSKAAAFAQFNKLLWILAGLLVVGVALIVGIGVLLARSISRNVRKVAVAAAALAEGDVEQEISVDSHDEVGQMAASFQGTVEYIREMATVSRSVADGDLTVHVEPRSERDTLGTAIASMVTNLREVVTQVADGAGQIAESGSHLGQVTAETGGVVRGVSHTMDNLAASTQETSRSVQSSSEAVRELSQAIDSIAKGASEQTRQVQSAATTASRMASDIERVAADAGQVSEASLQTKASAEHGAAAVRETVASMAQIQQVVSEAVGKVEELGKLGEKIGAVVETIDDIAEQTNLLALNAAIEAARAGEHGRGFAVVADEVRKLAERSQRETKAIADLIREVQGSTQEAVRSMELGSARVEEGSARADQAGHALAEILTAVEATVEQVGGIATAAQEMAAGARGVVGAMETISAVVEDSSAATEEMAAQAGQVTGTIDSIAAASSENGSATEQVSASAQEISGQIERIAEEAEHLASTSENLRTLVAQFRLEAETAPAGKAERRADGPARRTRPSRLPKAS